MENDKTQTEETMDGSLEGKIGGYLNHFEQNFKMIDSFSGST